MNEVPYHRFHREFARYLAAKYADEYPEFERTAIIEEREEWVREAEKGLALARAELAKAKGEA